MRSVARAEALVLGWARAYTRGLDEQAQDRRLGELASDCHEQRRWGDEVGASPVAVATSMVARTLAGMPADLLWRQGQLATSRDRSPHPGGRPMGRWIKDNWWVALAALVGTMYTAAGVMFPFEGEVEGGLPWWGGMLVMLSFGALMLGGVWYRRRRRAAGDWMIAAATLPLFPLFWTIVLPVTGLLIAIPAVIDAADAGATSSISDADGRDTEEPPDRATPVLLGLVVVAAMTAILSGTEEVAYALVSPVLATFAAHVVVRRSAFGRARRLGLTAVLATGVHLALTLAVVVLGDPGVVDLRAGLPAVTNVLMATAGIGGLGLFLLARGPSRGRARPA